MDPRPLDWALWRSFLAILREGSLTGAAKTLGVAHPTVRRHLDNLERGLGEPLFIRSPSGLVATELAHRLRAPAQAMEATADLLMRVSSAPERELAGTVRIAASDVIGVEVLPETLSSLKARHPKLSVELVLSNRIEDVLRHDADIAVRLARPAQDGLVARKLGTVALGLYAHEAWLARHGQPASLPQLLASGWLIGQDRGTDILRVMNDAGFRAQPADFGFRTDNDLAQLAALRAGLGVGVCHKPLAERYPALRPVLPALAHTVELWLVTHPNLQTLARIRAALDALATGLGEYVGDTREG